LLLLMLSALALIAAPLATAAASAAPSTARGGDPLALLVLQQAELKDPLAATNDRFGVSVALSGDTALIGAYDKTVSGQADAGAVYVYTRSGATWSQQAELKDPLAATNDAFGRSVALSGDTALIGAYGKTVSGQDGAGAAYVFVRTGRTWSQQAELTASNAAANDEFGDSVALSGKTALIGACSKTVSGQGEAGAAYVFVRTGTTWTQQAELPDPDAASDDQFGFSVTLAGDTAVVGAWQKTVGTVSVAGAAYVFVRSGTTWSRQAELSDPDAANNDAFGSSVALSGDTALIGAWGKTVSGQTYAGAAYVFVRSGTTWSQQAELTASNAATDECFGSSVALAGDTALIGAWGKTVSGQTDAGAAYICMRSGTTWSQQAQLNDPDAAANDFFGWPLALCGDTVLLGANGKTVSGQADAGAAYVDVWAAPSLSLKAKAASIKVGKSVTLSGLVKHFLGTGMTVQIERRVGKKLTVLETLTLTKSGAFTWTMKPKKAGKWVFEAACKSGGVSYSSKSVTVQVHK